MKTIAEHKIVTMDTQDMKDSPVKTKKPGGTFASMSLARPIIRAVERKGYKLATPIQRKCIPIIMSGIDVVAMARTGSGKSAAFLLPLIDKLKIRQPKSNIRGLVVSPTRELASQTFKFAKEFTRYTNLVSHLMIGGESISHDFETIISCPDILIATPGRLAHVLVEMKRKLDGIEIVVFDEADRLFEPGFKEIEQVNEICQRLPDSKQTLLFSATIPHKLAEFAKAGLKNPHFVRLDVDANLSDTLKTVHLHCNSQDKFAVLIHLLKKFVNKSQLTAVFMPTRHHIEYAKILLDKSTIDSCAVYSSMDPEARKINIEKFTKKLCYVMLVTDIAARGIDIPLLDFVINFNFPFKPKLFVHRVGRVARAGKFGCAISLVSHDETPYLHSLHLFLDKPMMTASRSQCNRSKLVSLEDVPDKILGTVPQEILDNENDILKRWHDHNDELTAMVKVCDNAMKPYLKAREAPTPFSVKTAKEIHRSVIGSHPMFDITSQEDNTSYRMNQSTNETIEAEFNMLDRIRSYKPQATIFEVGHIKGNKKTEAFSVMQKKRKFHDKIPTDTLNDEVGASEDKQQDIESVTGFKVLQSNMSSDNFEDSKFYLKYQPKDHIKEKGLELDRNKFDKDINRATLNLVADDEDNMKKQIHQTAWDRKKKKYIRTDGSEKVKKIKTESGAYISASYSSGLYEKWKSHSKVDQRDSGDDIMSGKQLNTRHGKKTKFAGSVEKLRSKLKPHKTRRRELKNSDEMLKDRNIKEKREAILRIKTMKKAERQKHRATKAR